MLNLVSLLAVFIASGVYADQVLLPPKQQCNKIAGKHWVSPQEARACMSEMTFNKKTQANVLDVITRTMAFHASTNYQLQAPKPYDEDVHWDLLSDLEEIRTRDYASDFDFHLEVQKSMKRVNDGHLMYANWCYDGVYITYNPFPLVLLTNTTEQIQNVYISPIAHDISSSVFGSEVAFWEDLLGEPLERFSGARVVLINGEDPFSAVNANAKLTGRFQGLSSRQNAFFSSSTRGTTDWHYVLGDFAELVHPVVDSISLTIQRVGSISEETITVPYRSKFNRQEHFTGLSDYQKKFCTPTKDTNGHHLYQLWSNDTQEALHSSIHTADMKPTSVVLPQTLQPNLPPLRGSNGAIQLHVLEDNTGILVIGSFEGEKGEEEIKCSLLEGLQTMHAMGVEKLIIDLTNNAGGYVCVAQFLHRLLMGEIDDTHPQPGLDTTMRVTPVAQRIVKNMLLRDPQELTIYNREWYNATNYPIDLQDEDWFRPINTTINGRHDSFSQRLGKECDVSFSSCGGRRKRLPTDPFFKSENLVLLSNGRCGSSCALFSVLLAKKQGVTTVVTGGISDVPQQYCGYIGGESVRFSDIDTALITTGLKTRTTPYQSDVPPPLEVNAAMTVTWRLAYGVHDPSQPEEWQDHTATIDFPLTADTVNKPQAVWEAVSLQVFSTPPALQVQV